jgi:hypothetical protein
VGFPLKPVLKQQLLGWQEELTANFKVELLIYKLICDKITFAQTRVRHNIQIRNLPGKSKVHVLNKAHKLQDNDVKC